MVETHDSILTFQISKVELNIFSVKTYLNGYAKPYLSHEIQWTISQELNKQSNSICKIFVFTLDASHKH